MLELASNWIFLSLLLDCLIRPMSVWFKPALHHDITRCTVSIFGLYYFMWNYVCLRHSVPLSGPGSSVCASSWCFLICWSCIFTTLDVQQSEVSCVFDFVSSTSRFRVWFLLLSSDFSDGKCTLEVTKRSLNPCLLCIFRLLLTIWLMSLSLNTGSNQT